MLEAILITTNDRHNRIYSLIHSAIASRSFTYLSEKNTHTHISMHDDRAHIKILFTHNVYKIFRATKKLKTFSPNPPSSHPLIREYIRIQSNTL